MVNKKTWKQFQDSGLLWWINMILHTFGWAIALNVNEEGEITDAFPARVKYRGFGEKENTDGYIRVSKLRGEKKRRRILAMTDKERNDIIDKMDKTAIRPNRAMDLKEMKAYVEGYEDARNTMLDAVNDCYVDEKTD